MRIAVDGRSLASSQATGLRQQRGIARYTANLLAAAAAERPQHDWVALAPRGASAPAGVTHRSPALFGRAGRAASALTGRPRLERVAGGADVAWLPAPAPVAVGVPYVLTVHDLSSETLPGAVGPYERLWARLASPRALAERAHRVLADSAATRDEALRRWGLDPERVELVRPGVWHPPPASPQEIASVCERLGISRPYLLYVGALEPRKQIELLLAAYGDARARGLRSGLVLAGEGPLAAAVAAAGDGVVAPGRVGDRDLAALYAGARATVLASALEGFGFTPLESLAAGTAVVVSDLPVLRETLGPAALWVPPSDRGALAGALVDIDGDPALRERIVAAGAAALAPLSWRSAAQRLCAALASAAAEGA